MLRVACRPSDLEVRTRALGHAIGAQQANEEFEPQPPAPHQHAEAKQRDSDVQSRTMLYHAPQVRDSPDQGAGEDQQEDRTRQGQDGEEPIPATMLSRGVIQKRQHRCHSERRDGHDRKPSWKVMISYRGSRL